MTINKLHSIPGRAKRLPPLRVGVGGPVGSGKTTLVEMLCKAMRERWSLVVVTNDIYTKEDQRLLTVAGALEPERIMGVETGGCPHTAIREDASINLEAVDRMLERFPDADIVFIESVQSGDGIPAVDISAKPLCNNYQAVNNLMLYKQAAHYAPSTNIGGGMRDAITLLDNYGRPGARPNIVLMTDGNSNVSDGTTTLPNGFASWFDGYDGAGSTYNISFDSPSNSELTARKQLLYEVNRAVGKGYTVHTIAVGADADWRTLQAIAFYGKGTAAYVPGGTSVEEMQAGLLAAFHKIAGLVPPAKLLSPTAP